jgi:hypothetical protein
MKHIAIALYCIVVLGLIVPAIAGGRQPGQAELDRIDRTRTRIRENGWNWQAGPTSGSNLSDEEFQRLLGLRVPPDFDKRFEAARRTGRLVTAPPGMFLPASFDWRAMGGVTPVKNQGACGSCWAFSAAAALESRILIRSGLALNISEQAVLSCNPEGDDCAGGWMETAYDVWSDRGAVLETCMPYHELDAESCTQGSCEPAAYLDGYYYVDNTVEAIKTALLDGPVAAAMAVCGGFNAYTGGCYEDNCTEINHAVTIVGWDDDMCGGEGAWIVKNSWGPDWGDNGYIYMKYGTCHIGYGAAALDYTPGQTVHFFHHSHATDDSAGDGDGKMETGEVISLAVTILNIGAETATNVSGRLESLTAGVSVIEDLAAFPEIPQGETASSVSPHFSFTLAAGTPSCGPLRFRMMVASDQGSSTVDFGIEAGEVVTVFADDFETDRGWTVGSAGDGAVTGVWELGDPDATWWGDQPVQPGEDHTDGPGTDCYVTGRSAGSSQGTNDVDGGKTTLSSPVIDLSGMKSATLTYYRWYASETGSNPNDDDFIVDVSGDGGGSWTNLETVAASAREWVRREFCLEDFISLTGEVMIRFVADDSGVGGSIVEAAIDDFEIRACGGSAPDHTGPAATLLAPNGGETCTYDTDYDVRWTATDDLGVVSVAILLSTDGGISYPDTIARGEANDGSYLWHVPDIGCNTARIKVVAWDAAGNKGEDAGDADFILWGSLSTVDGGEDPGAPGRLFLEVRCAGKPGLSSMIVYGLPVDSEVELDVYDVTGRLAVHLLGGPQTEGYHTLALRAAGPHGFDISPGVYFVRLASPEAVRTARLVIAR